MSDRVAIWAPTAEAIEVVVTVTSSDPTGTPPGFAVTSPAATTPGSFTAGSWDGTWVDGQRITAITPLIGDGQDLDVTSGEVYALWIRVVAGSEDAKWVCAIVTVK